METSKNEDLDSSNSDGDMDLQNEDYNMDSNESNCEADVDESVLPEKSQENLAWADAMARILKTNKPKRRKTIVLSRAKRANEPKVAEVKEEELDFEIEGENKADVKIEPADSVTKPVDKENPIKRLKVLLNTISMFTVF